MTTARQIITDALTFHLNRLSPGETLDADTAAVCLGALNAVIDDWNTDSYALLEFSSLDAEQDLPTGYRNMLALCAAEKVAGVLLGGVPPKLMQDAYQARRRARNAFISPEVLNTATASAGGFFGGA